MHFNRHRSTPGNGYRSHLAGMGLAASRNSPDSSFRVHGRGFYNSSEYRNYSRSFGRGQPKSYHQPLQPSRRDVFMEAGRLAAEYLVSQGLLSANALPLNLKKKHASDFPEFKPKEGGSLPLAQEGGRTSALARLGNVASDSESSRRRFPEEYTSIGSRSHGKGRRRLEGSRSLTWSRENAKSGSCSDKAGASVDTEGVVSSAGRYDEKKLGAKDAVAMESKSSSIASEITTNIDDAGDLGSKSAIDQLPDNVAPEASGAHKDLPVETGGDISKVVSESDNMSTSLVDVKESSNNDESEKQNAPEDLAIQQAANEGHEVVENTADLLKLCKFVDIPKRTRSSLMHKASKADSPPIIERGISPDAIPPEISSNNVSVVGTIDATFSSPTQCPLYPDFDTSKTLPIQSEENIGELNEPYSVEQSEYSRSVSISDGNSPFKQDAAEGPPGFGRCTSLAKERGEKRGAPEDDARGETKKSRACPSPVVSVDNENVNIPKSKEDEPISQEDSILPTDEVVVVARHDNMESIDPFPVGDDEPCIEYVEENKCFTSSFKMRDLNLTKASGVSEDHKSDPILLYPSISETKKECAFVNNDSSISNGGIPKEQVIHAADGREIEIIDLESDSIQEDKSLPSSEKKDLTLYNSLEGFTTSMQSADDINNAQDNYSLMVSELLGNDITNCSSVQPDINTLHDGMGLHSGEGLLGDDDSIYMSLGEIPISFLQGWDHPPEDYVKPF